MHSQLRYIRRSAQRTWYNSPDADLYLWMQGEHIHQFEFCYSKGWHEKSIRWQPQQGCKKMCVDDGEGSLWRKQSAILKTCEGNQGSIKSGWQEAARAFRLASEDLPLQLRHFVLTVLTKELMQGAPIKTTIRP